MRGQPLLLPLLLALLGGALTSRVVAAPSSKILLYPYGHCMNSHLLVVERLGALLIESGHEVHMIVNSKFPQFRPSVQAEPLPAMTLLEFQAPANYTTVCEYDTIDYSLYSPLPERFNFFIETSAKYCDHLVGDTHLMAAMKRQRYDLFILEAIDPCSRILADFLDVPFIPLLTTGLGFWDGNPRPPSYIPAPIASFTPNMNFLERASNLVMKVMYDNIPTIMGFDEHFENIKRRHGINTSLSLADTFQRASVKLVNSDFTFDYVAPVEPDTVLVGGFAIRAPAPLTGELRAFVDGAGPSGVIVFTLGTVVKSFQPGWFRLFAEVFRQLPQRVVWHCKHGRVPDGVAEQLPANVLLLDWVPQTDLLAHPSVRLLVTHCGLNSAMEAVHFGVPIVGMPLFADQFSQSAKLTRHLKIGLQVDPFTLTNDTFYRAVSDVLNDPVYADCARTVSARFRDQLVSPAARTRFWVEYVLRHRGARHLKSHADKLNLFQYLSLDVMLCITCILLIFVKVVYILLKFAVCFVYRQIVQIQAQKQKLC